MKKILVSGLAALTIGAASAAAGDMKLYTDENGQVFTTAGEGRTELKRETTPVFAKASKLKFSGVHYLGYVNSKEDGEDRESYFETRRNYLQVKAYLFDDPKSYMRMTLDTFQNTGEADAKDGSSWEVRLKYAFLYLNEVLPYTGIEVGQVHRPWIDYEEHQSWSMRSISKVYVEASEAAHLTNSADLGFNIKTKTPYFTSEIGLFNGEGYHAEETGAGNSLEWRATAAVLGNGKKKRKLLKDSYFDASFFGQYNMDSSKNDEETYAIYALHTVYNQPAFLVAAQYVMSDNDNEVSDTSQYNGQGFSVNGTFRFGENKEYSVLGRYDNWTAEKTLSGDEYETNNYIYGAAWQQNKNVKWLLSGQTYDPKDGKSYKGKDAAKRNDIMLTAEVHW